MAKMVKLTDEVGAALEKWAEKDDTSLTGEIKMLLDMREGKGVNDSISARLDKMAIYLEKKFVDLEAALDGAVLSNSSSSSSSSSSSASYKSSNSYYGTPVDWETLRDMWLEFLPYEAEEWLPGREEAFRNSDNMDMGVYYIKNGLIVSDDTWGHADWMKVSPRVEEYLSSHGVEV